MDSLERLGKAASVQRKANLTPGEEEQGKVTATIVHKDTRRRSTRAQVELGSKALRGPPSSPA